MKSTFPDQVVQWWRVFAVLLVVAFPSCKKDYSCRCVSGAGLQIFQSSKKEAANRCSDYEQALSASSLPSDTCFID